MPKYTLDDYLSREEAVEYLASIGHSVPEGTFISHIHIREIIVPISLGERIHRQTRELSARSLAFTKRMLRKYADKQYPVEPTAAELANIVDTKELAEMTGMSPALVKKRLFVQKAIDYKTVGRVTVVLRRDAEDLE